MFVVVVVVVKYREQLLRIYTPCLDEFNLYTWYQAHGLYSIQLFRENAIEIPIVYYLNMTQLVNCISVTFIEFSFRTKAIVFILHMCKYEDDDDDDSV